ncbi:hypothetical protein M5689_024946 [Euphorbia peplus]|nr:hypothetical protein M5689_024946 [Euphorbia peplus]
MAATIPSTSGPSSGSGRGNAGFISVGSRGGRGSRGRAQGKTSSQPLQDITNRNSFDTLPVDVQDELIFGDCNSTPDVLDPGDNHNLGKRSRVDPPQKRSSAHSLSVGSHDNLNRQKPAVKIGTNPFGSGLDLTHVMEISTFSAVNVVEATQPK